MLFFHGSFFPSGSESAGGVRARYGVSRYFGSGRDRDAPRYP